MGDFDCFWSEVTRAVQLLVFPQVGGVTRGYDFLSQSSTEIKYNERINGGFFKEKTGLGDGKDFAFINVITLDKKKGQMICTRTLPNGIIVSHQIVRFHMEPLKLELFSLQAK